MKKTTLLQNNGREESIMYLFWFIPLLLGVVIGIWLFYNRAVAGGAGGRREGKTLVDKNDEPPRS